MQINGQNGPLLFNLGHMDLEETYREYTVFGDTPGLENFRHQADQCAAFKGSSAALRKEMMTDAVIFLGGVAGMTWGGLQMSTALSGNPVSAPLVIKGAITFGLGASVSGAEALNIINKMQQIDGNTKDMPRIIQNTTTDMTDILRQDRFRPYGR